MAEQKKSESSEKSGQLKVSAVMATVKVSNDRIVHLYRGDVVPEDATKESVDNLKDLGFVTTDDDVLPA